MVFMKKATFRSLYCLLLVVCMLAFSVLPAAAETSWLQQNLNDGKQIINTLRLSVDEYLGIPSTLLSLLNSATLQFSLQGENAAGIALQLDGTTAVSLNARIAEDGIYLQTDAIGKEVLLFSFADVNAHMDKLMLTLAEQPGAEAFVSVLTSYSAMLSFFSSDSAAPQVLPAEMGAIAPISKLFDGDPAMQAWAENLPNRIVTTRGLFTGTLHDPASTKEELLLTRNDLTAILDSQFLRNLFLDQFNLLALQDLGLVADDPDFNPAAFVDSMLSNAKERLNMMAFEYPLTVLYQGTDVVSLTLDIRATTHTETDAPPISGDGHYEIDIFMNAVNDNKRTAYDVSVSNPDITHHASADDDSIRTERKVLPRDRQSARNEGHTFNSVEPAVAPIAPLSPPPSPAIGDIAAMLLQYNKLTDSETTSYTLFVAAEQNNSPIFVLDGVLHVAENKSWTLDSGINLPQMNLLFQGSREFADEQNTLTFRLAPAGEKSELLLEILSSEGDYFMTHTLYLYLNDGDPASLFTGETPILLLNLHSITQEPDGRFDPVTNATDATAVQLLQIIDNLTSTYNNLIDLLPADVRELLL